MFFLETVQAIVLALSIFIIVYLFLFQPHRVSGRSMYTTFDDGEFLLTNKLSYRLGSPERGDIVVFKAPKTEPCSEIECEYIKRIIGLPGEAIKVSNGHYYINGIILEENYVGTDVYTNDGTYLPESIEKTIPDGYYFVSGDNRPYSRDAREFGPVPYESIVGKAWFRYWPVNKTGLIKH